MNPSLHPLLAALFAGVLLSACTTPQTADDDDTAGTPDASTGGGADAGSATPDAGPYMTRAQWLPCPLHSEGTGPDAECALVPVPLNASEPGGPLIDVFVKRWRPAGGRGLRALWMLQGGPGASGYVFEGLAEQFATRFPDVDYYMPDHRGTGRSTRLGCPAQEASSSPGGIFITDAEWPACLAAAQAEYGDQLAAFNTTNAANDLGILMEAAREGTQPQFVYGVSYGTYWAHRYVQLYPDQADGVVFDSIAPPGISLFRQDQDANEAAKDFLCSADAFCGGKLGPDAWGRAEALVQKLKDGHCPEIAVAAAPTHVLFRRAFGSFLMDASMRAYVPAIIRRADRCEPRDVAALRVFMAALNGVQPVGENLRQWGWILSQNILHSEFNENPPLSGEQLEAIREASVASRDVTLGFQVNVGVWPRYPLDAYVSQWATSTLPMLFLQGGLDPATLLRKAREMKPHFTAPHQTWVELPTATHTTLVSSPFVDASGQRRSCGTRMLMAFLEDPTATLDTSCVAQIPAVDFTLVRPETNRALLGTEDAWE
jgi:pimeloyl-ACP methyl ester carboxylesterase